jgi:hypothetical protein
MLIVYAVIALGFCRGQQIHPPDVPAKLQRYRGKKMAFVAPTPQSNSPKVADLENALIVVEPTEYVANIETVHGPSDAVAARIINVDSGETFDNMLFFNVALKGAFKNYVGQQLIGRIIKGVAKTPGKSAPWIFADASANAADVAKGQAALAGSVTTAPIVSTPAAALGQGAAITPEVAALLAQLGATPTA